MISTGLTTLESQGPNKPWKMDRNCRDLGMTSMTDNATTTARSIPKTSSPGAIPAPLVNMVNTSNDTTMEPVPEGTVESMGANG